jgi:hypothetical protein
VTAGKCSDNATKPNLPQHSVPRRSSYHNNRWPRHRRFHSCSNPHLRRPWSNEPQGFCELRYAMKIHSLYTLRTHTAVTLFIKLKIDHHTIIFLSANHAIKLFPLRLYLFHIFHWLPCKAFTLEWSRFKNLLLTKSDSLLSDEMSLRQEICICKSAFGIRMHAVVTRFIFCSPLLAREPSLAPFVGRHDLRRDGVLLFS